MIEVTSVDPKTVSRAVLVGALAALAALAAEAGTKRHDKFAHELAFADVNPRSASHGRLVDLRSTYGGRGTVLQFVASWCEPCRRDLPHLQALADSGEAPVLLVAADEGPAGTENILIVAERAALTVPLLYVPPEAADEVERRWRHEVLPATYFIDAKGRIRAMREGALSAAALREATAKVIARRR
jgi:thiol-disulfide isomerase/thioredoxin